MTTAVQPTPHRILLGVGGTQHLHVSIDMAVMLASGFRTALLCVVVEQEDLVAVAGLPFARTFGRGGMSAPVTQENVEGYFRRVARTVEHELVERCTRVNVTWSLSRPQGDYVHELMASVETGDVVVVNRRDIHAGPADLPSVFRAILGKASAVVIANPGLARRGAVLALTSANVDGKALALARDIARATGNSCEMASPDDFFSRRFKASIVVAPLELAETGGLSSFLKSIDAMGAAAVLV
jgi:hypothetical protein